MPIDNPNDLEKRLIQLFEENGYVESYVKNEHHKDSAFHVYFLKDMYRREGKKVKETIQCGIKYSKIYAYVEFTIYVLLNNTPEQTLEKAINFNNDRYDYLLDKSYENIEIEKEKELELQSKSDDLLMKDIRELLSKSEKMCDFLHMIFGMEYWITDMSETCKIYAYCPKCGMLTFVMHDIYLFNFFKKPILFQEPDRSNLIDINDLDKIDISQHIC